MRYAALINNKIHYAPNPIKVGDTYIGNPPEEVYTEAGYLPVIETDPPETDAQHYAEPKWMEKDGQIVQSWEVKEIPYDDTADKAEAYDILMGVSE